MKIAKRAFSDGSYFVARPIIDGEKQYLKFKTKTEVERAYYELKLRHERRRHGLDVDRGHITLDALADLYLDQYQGRPRSKRSIRERLLYARRAFGHLNVRDLTADTIGKWNANLAHIAGKKKGQPLSPTTRSHALVTLRQVLTFGLDAGYLTKNPAGSVQKPSPARRTIHPFETWDEVFLLAGKAGRTYGPLVRFACATGLRPEEWMALRWCDVNLFARNLRIEQTVSDGQVIRDAKTPGSLRTVELTQIALDALDDLGRQIGTGLIFTAPGGSMLNLSNFRRRVWKPALAAAGLNYRAIDTMRHTYATLALSAGKREGWIAAQMGHTDTRMIARTYGKWLPQVNRREAEELDAVWGASIRTGHEADTGVAEK